MARIDVGIFIRASPERVWQVAADLPRRGEWVVGLHRLRVTGHQAEGSGVVLEVTSRLFGLPLVHDVVEVARWEPPGEMTVVHRGQFAGTGRFLLRPVLDGTVFLWQEEFQPPLGRLGELLFALLLAPHLRRAFGRSLENLRRLAEGSVSPSA